MSDAATDAIEQRVGKELAAVPPRAGGRIQAIVPQTIEELKYVANLIRQAGLAPDSYKNDAGKIALGIMKGAEVGMAPLTALQWIAIINGRPTIWGDGAIALVQSRGVLEKIIETEIGTKPGEQTDVRQFDDGYGVEVAMYRRGQSEPYIGRFTVGDAKRAKLWAANKAPWLMYPKRMLRMRAIGFAIRNGFADCLSGMMIREEVEDIPAAPEIKDTAFLDDMPSSAGETMPALGHEPTDEDAAPGPPETEQEPFCHAYSGEATLPCDDIDQFIDTLANWIEDAEDPEDKAALYRGNIDGVMKVLEHGNEAQRARVHELEPPA